MLDCDKDIIVSVLAPEIPQNQFDVYQRRMRPWPRQIQLLPVMTETLASGLTAECWRPWNIMGPVFDMFWCFLMG